MRGGPLERDDSDARAAVEQQLEETWISNSSVDSVTVRSHTSA
jgi:hypothetical protein